MPLLYINADDFGLHTAVNEAIAKCVEFGSVNSVSAIANGLAPDYQLLRQLQAQGVKIGVHLTWVNEQWITKPYYFSGWPQLFLKVFTGREKFLHEMQLEGEQQIKRLLNGGIKLNHVDSHQHTHVFPGVWEVAKILQHQYGIPHIRIPAAKNILLSRQNPGGWALQMMAAAKRNNHDLYCAGIKNAGHYIMWGIISELRRCKGHDTMFIAHPGNNNRQLNERYSSWGFDWENEYDALLRPQLLNSIAELGFILPRG